MHPHCPVWGSHSVRHHCAPGVCKPTECLEAGLSRRGSDMRQSFKHGVMMDSSHVYSHLSKSPPENWTWQHLADTTFSKTTIVVQYCQLLCCVTAPGLTVYNPVHAQLLLSFCRHLHAIKFYLVTSLCGLSHMLAAAHVHWQQHMSIGMFEPQRCSGCGYVSVA